MTPAEQRLARRIARQRARLRWFERLDRTWGDHYRRRALAYRKQLDDLGIKPVDVWSPIYRLDAARTKNETK